MFLKALLDYDFDPIHRDEFNSRMYNVNEQNMLFVRHHYACDRYDTKFWKDYRLRRLPKKLLELYDGSGRFINNKNRDLRRILGNDTNITVFNEASWWTVHKGKSNKFTKNLI